MELTNMDYFKNIGKLLNVIHTYRDYDRALREGAKILLECSEADYVSLWYKRKKDSDEVFPYYWICPIELASEVAYVGEGIIGKCIKTNSPVCADAQNSDDFAADFDRFKELDVKAMYAVPFEENGGGCILFMKNADTFSDDEINTYQILVMMVSMYISEGEYIDTDDRKKEVILSARGIKKTFENGGISTKVLKGINLDVIKGEFLVILGESGCGKTTFLNVIGGMQSADEGVFSFMGTNLEKATKKELTEYRRKNIGFVFQSYNLMPNLTAKQNLDLIAELVDDPMDSEEALELVGLSDKKDNYPSQLSGGQQQRVSIARALVKRPKLIFADEPTAALDYETSIEVLSAFEKVVDSGTTLVMVTHNEEITKMANRVVRFRNGRTHEMVVNKKIAKATDLVW